MFLFSLDPKQTRMPDVHVGLVLLAVLSVLALAGGLWLGVLWGLDPCPLCIFQRLLYVLLLCWSLGALFFWRGRYIFLLLLLLTACAGLATAAYQSWLQYQPQLAMQCGAGGLGWIDRLVDHLGEWWPAFFMATGFCTTQERILGLSLANWSLLVFMLCVCVATFCFWRTCRFGMFRN